MACGAGKAIAWENNCVCKEISPDPSADGVNLGLISASIPRIKAAWQVLEEPYFRQTRLYTVYIGKS